MAKRKFKLGDIVRIDWRDASSRDGWIKPDDLPEDGAMLTSTVGFFLKQSKHGIFLAALINENNQVNDSSFIPRGMVLKTFLLKKHETHGYGLSRRKGKK